jgi:hypothetical protein
MLDTQSGRQPASTGKPNPCVMLPLFHIFICSNLLCSYLLILFSLHQDAPLTGRKADVIKAAHLCAEAALRLVKPGNQVKWLASALLRGQLGSSLVPDLIVL